MVKSYSTVTCRCRTEVLEIGFGIIVKGREPLIQSCDEGNVLHDLHAYCGAEQLGFRLMGGPYLDKPVSLSSLIGQKAEVRNTAHYRAEEIEDSAVSVASGTEDTVCVNDR